MRTQAHDKISPEEMMKRRSIKVKKPSVFTSPVILSLGRKLFL